MAFGTISRAVRFHRWQDHLLAMIRDRTGETRSSVVRRWVTQGAERERKPEEIDEAHRIAQRRREAP